MTRTDGLRIAVRRLDPELPLPSYARPGDAGLDLFAADAVTLAPGGRAAVPTGLAVAIPEGYAGFVHARSGRRPARGSGSSTPPASWTRATAARSR